MATSSGRASVAMIWKLRNSPSWTLLISNSGDLSSPSQTSLVDPPSPISLMPWTSLIRIVLVMR